MRCPSAMKWTFRSFQIELSIIIVADFNGFDGNVLRQDEWQIVIKYLDCQRQNDRRYQKAGGIFDKPLEALNLLIRYVIKREALLESGC